MTPVTKEQTIEVIDDAIAFEKAVDRSAIDKTAARRFAAELGALAPEQIVRICRHAHGQRLAAQARERRKRSR